MTTQPLLLDDVAPAKRPKPRGAVKGNRVEGDVYLTPEFMTHHLCDALEEVGFYFGGLKLYEPCVGTGRSCA